MIPLVENAFKHGVKYNVPSFVQISIEIRQQQLVFKVKNSKHLYLKNEFDQQYGGIGLENVRKRLNLIYSKRHSLEIKEEVNTFMVDLKLRL